VSKSGEPERTNLAYILAAYSIRQGLQVPILVDLDVDTKTLSAHNMLGCMSLWSYNPTFIKNPNPKINNSKNCRPYETRMDLGSEVIK
jgi:hypothetical protein